MATNKWTVIGAGPSGILAVAKLIDNGIEPKLITWIDPKFEVGYLGSKWHEVPSNTRVKLFVDFLYIYIIIFIVIMTCWFFKRFFNQIN